MIRFTDVDKQFGRKTVLDGFSLHVQEGETVSLVGTSGAGKSVTLKHMVRLLTPNAGAVEIGGQRINDLEGTALSDVRARFGYLFQGAALLQWMSVGDNVALPLRETTKMPEDEILERVRSVLGKVNLLDAIDRMPSDISGGMQKRAGLARAIVTEPEIILYDEPTSGLDPVTSRTIDQLILDLQEDLGITSVVVTHDMISALDISDRIAMLHQGRVVEVATPHDFLVSEQEIVRSFLDAQCISRNYFQEKDSR